MSKTERLYIRQRLKKLKVEKGDIIVYTMSRGEDPMRFF